MLELDNLRKVVGEAARVGTFASDLPTDYPTFGLKKIYKKSKLYLKYWISLLGAIFGLHFGGQILAPFLGPFFNLHFGVQK